MERTSKEKDGEVKEESEKDEAFLERYEQFKRDHLDRLIDEGYEGQFVYLVDGKVVDKDGSYRELFLRMSKDPAFTKEKVFFVRRPRTIHRRNRNRRRPGEAV